MITAAHLSQQLAHQRLMRPTSSGRRVKTGHVCMRRPIRTKTVETTRAALPDFVQYSEIQLVSWVLPMIIAGRVMDMHYEDIGKGLVALGVFKTCLHVILSSN